MNRLEVNQDEEYAADEREFDELSGRWLDGDKVTDARSEEISYMEKELDMFVPATWEECVEETGRPPISTKWVDVNKGTVQNQIIRSRLVARDFRVKDESDRSDPLRRCRFWRPSACCLAWLFGVVGRSRVKGTRSC